MRAKWQPTFFPGVETRRLTMLALSDHPIWLNCRIPAGARVNIRAAYQVRHQEYPIGLLWSVRDQRIRRLHWYYATNQMKTNRTACHKELGALHQMLHVLQIDYLPGPRTEDSPDILADFEV